METAPATTVDEVPLEHLEHEICELSAHLAAAMCRWLVLVAEFDRRQGWSGWGLRSCAHWLNWKCVLLGSSGASSTAMGSDERPVVKRFS